VIRRFRHDQLFRTCSVQKRSSPSDVREIGSRYHSPITPEMSTKSCQSAVGLARTKLCQSRPFRITPPPPYVQERTYFTRRSTSFYTNSYPQSGLSGVEIPYTPPSPASDKPTSSRNEYGVHEDGRRKERKAKYLESLMDKAGELSLRCMSILSVRDHG